jgi:uncharacterized protein DUF6714
VRHGGFGLSATSTEHRRAVVVEQIHRAFAGVGREGGVSLHEAVVIDNYGSQEERETARTLDMEATWQDIPETDIEQCDTALTFLDPIGFRYYLPAYMVWTLNHYEHSESMSVDSTIYALDYCFLFRGLAMERFRPFSREQSEAVCAFLHFIAEEAGGMADDTAARRALKRYWGQFC